MKKILLFVLSTVLVGFVANAQQEAPISPAPTPPLKSPFFPSEDLRSFFTILNTHTVSVDRSGQPKIFRGMEPREKLNEIYKNNITDVLIFKSRSSSSAPGEDSGEIEKAELEANGVRAEILPMPWKDIEDPYQPCADTLRALKYMKEVDESPDRKMFVHCTVGEDRTGMLVGLFRMLRDGWSKEKAFFEEMCRWGYEHGNPNKPGSDVVCAIRASLTPLYLEIAKAIRNKRLTWKNLSAEETPERVCYSIRYLKRDIGQFKCPISTEEMDPEQLKEPQPEPVCNEPEMQSLGGTIQQLMQFLLTQPHN